MLDFTLVLYLGLAWQGQIEGYHSYDDCQRAGVAWTLTRYDQVLNGKGAHYVCVPSPHK